MEIWKDLEETGRGRFGENDVKFPGETLTKSQHAPVRLDGRTSFEISTAIVTIPLSTPTSYFYTIK